MEEAFTAGIRPGGVTGENKVRILICHILASAGEPLSFDLLTDAVLADEVANYFEFAGAATALAGLDCVRAFRGAGGELVYELTDKGREVAATLSHELPPAVRERAGENVRALIKRRRIEKENLAAIDKVEDGYTVHMRVTDIGADLMELRLFMPTFEQAQKAKARFLADPASAYRHVLTALAEIE